MLISSIDGREIIDHTEEEEKWKKVLSRISKFPCQIRNSIAFHFRSNFILQRCGSDT